MPVNPRERQLAKMLKGILYTLEKGHDLDPASATRLTVRARTEGLQTDFERQLVEMVEIAVRSQVPGSQEIPFENAAALLARAEL